MTKNEVVEVVAKATGQKKKAIEATIDAYHEAITESLSKGGEVAVKGFGKFSVRGRKATTARNPQTGDQIDVPAKRVVKFTPALNLKKAVEVIP